MIALVAGGTRNCSKKKGRGSDKEAPENVLKPFLTSSAANFRTAVKGVCSGTLRLHQKKRVALGLTQRMNWK